MNVVAAIAAVAVVIVAALGITLAQNALVSVHSATPDTLRVA